MSPQTAVQTTCLPMASYTAAQEQAASAALAALPADNPLVQLTADYGRLRAANRACIAASTPKTGTPK